MAHIGILSLAQTVNTGGTFQYAVTLIESLKAHGRHSYSVFYGDQRLPHFCRESKNCRLIFDASHQYTPSSALGKKIAAAIDYKPFFLAKHKAIKESAVDLLVDLASSPLGFYLKIPYITVIYDIMHRYYPGFPEYSLWERLRRDFLYKKSAENSALTVVESEMSRQDLSKFYKIDKQKVKVLPCYPPFYLYKYSNLGETIVRQAVIKYKLPADFIFYPAQFWRHKNHLRLLEAVRLVKARYRVKVNVVFVGSARPDSRPTLPLVMEAVKKLGLSGQVFCLGYVPEEEMVSLYKSAVALVSPTLIGPTNIPVLEAMFLGVPVLCSNLFFMSMRIGNAGILFNPFDIDDMAENIYKIYTDEGLRRQLSRRGFERIRNMTLQKYAQEWEGIINEALERI